MLFPLVGGWWGEWIPSGALFVGLFWGLDGVFVFVEFFLIVSLCMVLLWGYLYSCVLHRVRLVFLFCCGRMFDSGDFSYWNFFFDLSVCLIGYGSFY